ncbi:MAG TPA: cobyrinic acid a,c-diamide synthase [Leptolyngbyaceae cyanobacterium]
MNTPKYKNFFWTEENFPQSILEKLPPPARKWAESLPWEERRYVLSLCHLLCASSPEMQADFLDEYTADGLVFRMLQDRDTQNQVQKYLKRFSIETELTEAVLKKYVRQFFIHSSQDLHELPYLYLEAALRLVINPREKNSVFNYILGFELFKMMFQLSWSQQERLSALQKYPANFIKLYIKPIQKAHQKYGVVVPKNPRVFFEKHDYFVQLPNLNEEQATKIVMDTFSTTTVSDFGFAIIRHPQALVFDYEYIFQPEQETIFNQDLGFVSE